MRTKNHFFIFLLVLVFSAGSIFAQNSATGTADVTIQLVKGLSIQASGDLNFGEQIVAATNQTYTEAPGGANGVQFDVTGHPNRSVTVDYTPTVTLNNDAWVTANGGTNSTLTFTADLDETGSTSTYSGANNVTDLQSLTLSNVSGVGKLYMWLGGSVDVPSTAEAGDYVGTFTVTVAY